MKKNIFVVWILLLPAILFASENGGYAGSFLRMGVGARAISMGNTGVAHPTNAYSTFYNPASFGLIEDHLVGLSYSFLSLDRRFEFVSFSMKVPPEAGFSIGWIESGVGDLKSYNSIGEITGDINQSANAVYFSFGRKFSDKLSIGVSLKILFEFINDGTDEFDYSSNGVGFDIGILYKINDDLILGGQVKDINSKFKANTDKIFERGGTTIDKFPVSSRIGAFYHTPLQWLRAAYDFEWSNKGLKKHHLGLEAVHGKNLALRIGLNGDNIVFGGGLDFMIFKTVSYLDYAFVPSIIDEGSSHVFSWQILF
ncbi:MAG: PorV/PorQ family protein [Calditrichia bacterium]|nr:PorV/PorQ family protein [Calditrichia bacterium]